MALDELVRGATADPAHEPHEPHEPHAVLEPPAPTVERWSFLRWARQRRGAALLRHHERELARLRAIDSARAALSGASALVEAGWMQGAWFQVQDAGGRCRSIGPLELRLLEGRQIIGACLVGAVVEAAGGTRQSQSTPAGRALDLLWDTLQEERGWPTSPTFDIVCAPTVRAARVRELTAWNDETGRTRSDVLGLISAADSRAIREAAGAA